MVFIVIMCLLIIQQVSSPNIFGKNVKKNSKSFESRIRDLLDLPPLPSRSLVLREDNENEPEDSAEMSPFEEFNPTDPDSLPNTPGPPVTSYGYEIYKNEKLQEFRDKLKNQQFTISLPVAAIIVASTVVVTCCCTLYLRNRLMACINRLKPEKKLNKYLSIDPEHATKHHQPGAKLQAKKPESFAVPRARSLSHDYAHVATQNSTPNRVETPPTGCYGCLIANGNCTIDINLSELEYLAAHLDIFQCRSLIAALHYKSWNLPPSIDGAERKVDEDIPCLRQLLHWNSSPDEGLGKTHEHLEHRLRQIGRQDLANWLGKTVFKKLGNDIERSLEKPFGELGEQETQSQYPITLEPVAEELEENPWTWVDTILMAALMAAGGCLFFLIVAVIFHKFRDDWRGGRGDGKRDEEEQKLLDSDVESD